ncbi:DnaJ family domain-containing protein [Paenibacillus sp. PAMC21692]|uniref:DnaJ family domain-containing protein n=1 Tax=Paenibacillus sp. PAMC21692 TaxID=2762320 RepID=UPI00164D78B8|nr:DnaJ family domain-containing protein [Paenibacillus sp. PAMC21692]QNK57839.1 DUF1992 domain-containing protein [Paenibacillus sp. PAMC21692]
MDILRLMAEEKIKEAIRRGEFDNLPGAGKPLPPDDMEGVPEDLRVSYRLLKNAGIVPEEIQLRKEMVTLGDLLAACRNDGERLKLERELSLKKLRYQSLMSARGWQASGAFAEYETKVQQKLTENESES